MRKAIWPAVALLALVFAGVQTFRQPAQAQQRPGQRTWEYAVLYNSRTLGIASFQAPGEVLTADKIGDLYMRLGGAPRKENEERGVRTDLMNLIGSKGWEVAYFSTDGHDSEVWFKRAR